MIQKSNGIQGGLTGNFIAEQDGDIERKFKSAIVDMLQKLRKITRAYLARVGYDNDPNTFNVMLCYKIDEETDQEILNETVVVFKSMFGADEHLDILFLNHMQEQALREVCCPFFTTPMFQVQRPDFYLTLDDHVFNSPLGCFKRKKLIGINPNGYLLCDIKPGIIGQKYGLGAKNICQLLLVCRYAGVTLFPISKWPVHVHVIRSFIDGIENINYVNKTDISLMWWGSLYRNKKDIPIIPGIA